MYVGVCDVTPFVILYIFISNCNLITHLFSKTVTDYIYIYIYAFSRHFYPKRLTVAFSLYMFNQYVCSLGIKPTTFCAADAMLYPLSHTGTLKMKSNYSYFYFVIKLCNSVTCN